MHNLDNTHGVGRTAERDFRAVGITVAAAIHGNQEVVAAALDTEANLHIIAEYHGADGQAVRGNGGNAEGIAARLNDRPSNTEGITRRACGRADDKAIGQVFGQQFIAHHCAYLYQRGNIVLEHSHLVEREGIGAQGVTILAHLNQATLLHGVLPEQKEFKSLVNVLGRDIGKHTQMARVDAENWDARTTYLGSCAQKRTVASHGYGQVSIAGNILSRSKGNQLQMEMRRDKVRKFFFDYDFHAQLLQPPQNG